MYTSIFKLEITQYYVCLKLTPTPPMAEKIASQILAILLVKTLGSLMETATGRHPARPGGLPRDCCRILERALCLLGLGQTVVYKKTW